MDNEREWYRKARVARFHGESWRDFWAEHRDSILADFPDRAQRAALIDAMQCTVTLGIGPPVQPLLDSIPGVFRGSELEGRT